MPNQKQRATYSEIKAEVLETYFRFCRDRGLLKGWPHDQILGSVAYEFENAFECPLENLMLTVVQLVLNAGLYPDAGIKTREWLAEEIAKREFDEMFLTIPVDEAVMFRNDLVILKLI